MESSNLKNMVVLKNLPSNLVEEAIIFLKQNKKAIKLEKIENKTHQREESEKAKPKEKDYIVKEAEMLVNQYISKVEKTKEKEKNNKKMKQKYQKVKRYAWGISVLAMIELIAIIIT